MKVYYCLLCFCCLFSRAQTLRECRQRFDTYLNFRGSLSGLVKFEADAISIYNSQGIKVLAIYQDEIPALAHVFENSSARQQELLIAAKGTRKFAKREKDSLITFTSKTKVRINQAGQLPLAGYRIALDPGHFATNARDAAVEQKFLFFVSDSLSSKKDTVKLFESQLTFNTATILKGMLEEQGAQVFMTRTRADYTSFNCTFRDWIKDRRRRTLDSLQRSSAISFQKYSKLLKCNDYNLFWDFFRDYDLAHRAEKINTFDPHVTIIIHYNVDEKNAPWKKHTKKNFSMAFIGGAFTADNLDKPESRMNFLRLLLTDQLNRSQNLAQETVLNFNKILEISIASQRDADYLRDNCLLTSSPGVFCRNLALCRRINSPLVYGESLYQDNENESRQLMRSDLDIYGVKANDRLMKVARSYYQAVMQFLTAASEKNQSK
jgi:N-acetylmuramoyl-L-alanine amidase